MENVENVGGAAKELPGQADTAGNLALRAALQAARTKLLDRSLRNKLIHTSVSSTRARQVRIIDELSSQTFSMLASGKAMTFAAARRRGDADDGGDQSEEGVYVPPDEDTESGVASRHTDNKLQTRLTPEGLQKRLLNLYFESQTLEEEQGVNVLYLALGFLEWRESKASDTPRYAPLVLLPVELVRDGARDRFKIKLRQEDLLTNFSLQVWLKEQFAIDFPNLPDLEELDSLGSYYSKVRSSIGSREHWAVHENEIVLGFFSFAKFMLWRDLDPDKWPNADHLLTHDILNKILLRSQNEGDVDQPLIDEDERLDEKFPARQLVHVTEADSSQAIAIEEALAGKNLVIQGPPGTGKSQTITNLIAAAVQRGKRVLFIAEKMAALDVVNSRLNKARLSSVCLELHSRKAAKTQVLEQIKGGMASPVPPQWADAVFADVDANAKKLRHYADTLHKRGTNGFSPFELIGKIALLRREGTPTPDFTLPAAEAWTREKIDEIAKRIAGLADHVQLSGIPLAHPWRGINVETPDVLAQDRLRPLIESFYTATVKLLHAVEGEVAQLHLEEEAAIGELPEVVAALLHLADKPSGFDAIICNDNVIAKNQAILSALLAFERHGVLFEKVGHYQIAYRQLTVGLKAEALADAWHLIAIRPRGSDEFLLRDSVRAAVKQLATTIPKLKAFFDLKARLVLQAIPAALDMEWMEVRRALATHGNSIFRILSGEYRKASKQFRSVLKLPIKQLSERLELLDALIEAKGLAQLKDRSLDLLQTCGDLWNDADTDWAALEAALEWMKSADLTLSDLSVARVDAFKIVDDAPVWPPVREGQLELIRFLAEIDALAAELDGSPVVSLLGSFWPKGLSDLAALRAALAWGIEATQFEPRIHLRQMEVLISSDIAKSRAATLNECLEAMHVQFEALKQALELDEREAFEGSSLAESLPSFLQTIALQFSTQFSRITEWPPVRDDLAWLRQIGCEGIAERIYDGRLATRHIVGTLLTLAYEASWQSLKSSAGAIEKLHGDELTATVSRFRLADLDRIKIASDQVARAHFDQKPNGSAGAVGVLKDELKKSRKLKPVRKLVEEAGEAIQRFKPVFLMSPLSVAQYLPPGQLGFDLCVIDEASQVRPEDALGAIARCKQLVVVGDDKQLPPTNFFNRMVSEDALDDNDVSLGEEVRAAAVRDVESILNLCSRFPERMLKWHYRSEHPALIATSNRSFYKNQLMLPPSVLTHAGDSEIGLQFVQVAKGGYERGKTATNEIEADEVARAVLEHARRYPGKSLGIGTFSVAQRDCVRDRLEHWAAKYPELDNFIRSRANGDPLFVKNLENIQGDERDVIFISVGYGHDQDGRLTQQFGPIGRDGGERRLNVLITRARQRCVVFSSIVAEDIKSDEAPKPGISAFREFLKLAKDGFRDLPEATARGFDSDFEESVALAVRELGYEVHPQVGMAGFFVDLGVIDPRDAKRYLAGIECDGATYHSSTYARDRDRLRQSILESRGWRLHRVWSTDWFYRQEREVAKIKEFLNRLLSAQPEEPSEAIGQAARPSELPVDQEVTAAPIVPERRKLRPYEFADIRWRGRGDIAPHELDLRQLANLVSEIVAVEQPIHSDEVARRLASIFNLQRAGSRIQEAAISGLKEAARTKLLVSNKGFWRVVTDAPTDPRDRSSLPSAATVKKVEFICPTEMAAAARLVLQDNLALERDDLVTETARALGFARTGPDVEKAILKAIKAQLARDIHEDHLGRMRLADGLS